MLFIISSRLALSRFILHLLNGGWISMTLMLYSHHVATDTVRNKQLTYNALYQKQPDNDSYRRH